MYPWSAGYNKMAKSLAHMINNSMQPTESPQDLDKYKNMQKFMTTALCKNNKQSNNQDLKIPDLPDLDLLEDSRGRVLKLVVSNFSYTLLYGANCNQSAIILLLLPTFFKL